MNLELTGKSVIVCASSTGLGKATAMEFARIAVFLSSPANTYITGQTILVDGGMVRSY